MSILSDRDRTAVREALAKLAGPVKLVVFTSALGSETSAETECLVREVAECSDQVMVEILNLYIDRERAAAYGVDRVPAIVVEGIRDYGIRFFGIPMGYEFSNLIDSMLAASSGKPELSAATVERLQALSEPVHLQVFATPT